MQLINGTNWSTQFVRFTVLRAKYVVLLSAILAMLISLLHSNCFTVTCCFTVSHCFTPLVSLRYSFFLRLYTNTTAICLVRNECMHVVNEDSTTAQDTLLSQISESSWVDSRDDDL